jgi:hypothetical protein
MKTKPHIPAETWRRLQAFFEAGCTGTVVLEVYRGKLRHALLTERLESTDEKTTPDRVDANATMLSP